VYLSPLYIALYFAYVCTFILCSYITLQNVCEFVIRKGKQFHDLYNEYDVITNNFLYYDVYARFATLCSG